MKRTILFLSILSIAFSACKKQEIYPECEILEFSISEFPETEFLVNSESDPGLIKNRFVLPKATDLRSITVNFTLNEQGGVWLDNQEVVSGISKLDFTNPVYLKTLGPDGETDNYYKVVIEVFQPEAPRIENFVFTLNPNNITPTSGLLELELSEECVLDLVIKGQDNNDYTKSWTTSASTFSVPVIGLYPDADNQVTVRISNLDGLSYEERLFIKTPKLHADFPQLEILANQPERAEPGFYFVQLERLLDGLAGDRQSFLCMIDQYGKVRWIFRGDYQGVFTRLQNGNWIMGVDNKLYEVDMLGKRIGYPFAVDHFHHDAIEIPGGNILALTDAPGGFEDGMVELDRATGAIVREWDFRTILDTARPKNPGHPNPRDWFHNNAVTFDSIDNAYILSGRNQSALVKIDYTTDEIIWILGNHENWSDNFHKYLLTPTGENFEWQWGQHAPMLSFQTNSRLICFDNGSNRSWSEPLAAKDNYSRGVEYEIDESAMEVTQLWQYGKERGSEIYTPYISDADYLPVTDNRLICFGGILKNLGGEPVEVFNADITAITPAKNEVRLIEVSPGGEVIFELKIVSDQANYEGFRSYRAEKISLYPNED